MHKRTLYEDCRVFSLSFINGIKKQLHSYWEGEGIYIYTWRPYIKGGFSFFHRWGASHMQYVILDALEWA